MTYFRNWWWLWVIHGFLVWFMYEHFFFGNEKWFLDAYKALGLTREMNYAVWWSGICLFFSSIIYFRIAAAYHQEEEVTARTTWVILGVFSLALCMDEIGSIHETVAQFGEWKALAPFVLVFGAAFLFSIWRLLRTPGMVVPAIFILSGVLIFAGVAGLEFVEHNVEMDPMEQRIRLVFEEGIELVAIGLLITAGVLAWHSRFGKASANRSYSLVNFSTVLETAMAYPHWMLIALGLQISATVLFFIPNYFYFPYQLGEGNIIALFPVILFCGLGLYCLAAADQLSSHLLARIAGWSLIITSALQVYNLSRFLSDVTQSETAILAAAPDGSWLTLLLPWLIAAVLARRCGSIAIKTLLGHFGLILVVTALLSPGADEPVFSDCYFFLLSSVVAYSIFQLLCLLSAQADSSKPVTNST